MKYDRYRPQRNWGARIREVEYMGLPLIVLENELLRIGVLAGKGSDIVEFNYKPRDLDFVWLTTGGVRNPAEFLSTSPDPLATFVDTYPGGWQEVFPNGGAPAQWDGASFGQHGEVSNLPWDVRIDEESEARVAVTFTVRLLKSPYRIEKTLSLKSEQPTLYLAERVANESDVGLRSMWGHHLAFGAPFLDESCRIRIPDGVAMIPHPVPIHPEGRRVRPDARTTWPFGEGVRGDPIDLSFLPPRGTISEIVYLTDFPDGGWYEIDHPSKRVGISVEWDATVMPYLWYWMEFGATKGYPWYGRNYNIGLEPFSSYPTNGLPDAVANGSALTLGAGEERTFWLRATIIESTDD